jgi:CheY-like chemotaxis protein
MKNEYKILWIDDDHANVRGDVRNIRSFLNDHGIDLIINQVEVTPDNCPTREASFSEAVSDIDLDMVFIDFNMPEQGDAIIGHIRKNLQHYHLPILFYTGDKEPEKVLTKIFSDSLLAESNFLSISDGIYFCDRDHIYEKAKLILTSLLEKDNKPQRGRGLLMDKVSEIDAKIIQALRKLCLDVPETKQKHVLALICKKLENRKDKSRKLYESIQNKSYSDAIESLLSDDLSIDTHFRSETLREMLRYIEGKTENGTILSNFYNPPKDQPLTKSLIALRNDYAHKTGEKINETHDKEKCKYIRTETKRHLFNVKQLLGEI